MTIAIPFYNPGPSMLRAAVQSVFAQTYRNWKLILVDDGSTDGSLELALRVMDPRVSVVSDGQNRGLIARLNEIIELADGKYVARMDADDMMDPHRIEMQVTFLENHPEVDVVDSGAIVTDTQRNTVGVQGLDGDAIPDVVSILKWGAVLHPSIMARRGWYRRNTYDPNYPRAEDRELFVRTLPTSKIAHLAEPLHYYCYERNLRLKPFMEGYRSERRVLLRYGPRLVGWPATIGLYGRSWLKSLALPILYYTGQGSLVTRRAYRPIPDHFVPAAINTCRRIGQQAVPGWETLS